MVSDKILSNYQTFFPYVDQTKISAIITKKINDIDTNFSLFPIETNLSNYNVIESIPFNDLNQQFHRRYLIENNNKSIQITDLLEMKIMEYVNDITGIKNILYVNSILIIFAQPENKLDTNIHLINSKIKIYYLMLLVIMKRKYY